MSSAKSRRSLPAMSNRNVSTELGLVHDLDLYYIRQIANHLKVITEFFLSLVFHLYRVYRVWQRASFISLPSLPSFAMSRSLWLYSLRFVSILIRKIHHPKVITEFSSRTEFTEFGNRRLSSLASLPSLPSFALSRSLWLYSLRFVSILTRKIHHPKVITEFSSQISLSCFVFTEFTEFCHVEIVEWTLRFKFVFYPPNSQSSKGNYRVFLPICL